MSSPSARQGGLGKEGSRSVRAPEYERLDYQALGGSPQGAVTLARFPNARCAFGATFFSIQTGRRAGDTRAKHRDLRLDLWRVARLDKPSPFIGCRLLAFPQRAFYRGCQASDGSEGESPS